MGVDSYLNGFIGGAFTAVILTLAVQTKLRQFAAWREATKPKSRAEIRAEVIRDHNWIGDKTARVITGLPEQAP